MKIDYNIFDGESVSIKTVTDKTIVGKLHLHHMDYPKRLIFEINQKYYEEFQIREIKKVR
jgi:hypothetical protein